MGSYDLFGYLKHKLWPKERLGIALISLCAGGMPHIVGKISMKATIFLLTSPQLEVYTQNYAPPKLGEYQFREFRDSNLKQNDIWVLAPWPGTENTIRGKVVASPKFELW